jgi:hypothetical protein
MNCHSIPSIRFLSKGLMLRAGFAIERRLPVSPQAVKQMAKNMKEIYDEDNAFYVSAFFPLLLCGWCCDLPAKATGYPVDHARPLL